MVVPFFGGVPATAAIARTSVAIKSGAKTRLTGMFHAVFLLVSMLLLGPVMSKIPLSALAGVLLVTAWRMNEWETIRYIFQRKFKGASLKFIVTMIATIVFDLTVAILIGILVSLILLVNRLSRIEINYDKVRPERMTKRDSVISDIHKNSIVAYISGAMIFANSKEIADMEQEILGKSSVIFSMRGVSYMDISGAQGFMELIESLKKKGILVYICAQSNAVDTMMKRSGIYDLVGEDNFYWSVEHALLGEKR